MPLGSGDTESLKQTKEKVGLQTVNMVTSSGVVAPLASETEDCLAIVESVNPMSVDPVAVKFESEDFETECVANKLTFLELARPRPARPAHPRQARPARPRPAQPAPTL